MALQAEGVGFGAQVVVQAAVWTVAEEAVPFGGLMGEFLFTGVRVAGKAQVRPCRDSEPFPVAGVRCVATGAIVRAGGEQGVGVGGGLKLVAKGGVATEAKIAHAGPEFHRTVSRGQMTQFALCGGEGRMREFFEQVSASGSMRVVASGTGSFGEGLTSMNGGEFGIVERMATGAQNR